MPYQSPLIRVLRDRWIHGPHPMLVDHAAQARACPAPTLYLGARHWAQVFAGRGIKDGQRVHLPASPRPETLMMILGALRLGVAVSLRRDADGSEVDANPERFRGLMLDDGRTSEAVLTETFRSVPVREPVCWWSLGDWQKTETWRGDVLLALATGAELHLNLDHWRPDPNAEDQIWPAVVGSANQPGNPLPVPLDALPTPWIPANRALFARED